jgi:glyoxylase-like metal-dependent hydrolase (beta-lactamase superfamily II)
MKFRFSVALVAGAAVMAAVAFGGVACLPTNHASYASTFGTPHRSRDMVKVIDEPGPVVLTTYVSADWSTELGGLLNLYDPKAQAAKLDNKDEPIQIYFYVLRHPKFGMYIVDTGVQRAFRDAPEKTAVSGLVAYGMHLEKLKVQTALGDFLKTTKEPLRGVFLTHMHIDHISGMPDVPRGTPVFVGPGETHDRAALNAVIASTTDNELEGKAPVEEWTFMPDDDRRFDGVLDIFGDGSVWAIYTPGHTKGSTAYLVRTPTGPVLLTGDTCHTAWGWNNEVEPGGFTADHDANKASLHVLKELSKEHPSMVVHLGHQPLTSTSTSTPTSK